MAKGDEWGNPIREEALVRQGNEKCYQYRKKNTKLLQLHNSAVDYVTVYNIYNNYMYVYAYVCTKYN